jgi:hypothetical protein
MKSELKRKLLIATCLILSLYVLSAIYGELNDTPDFTSPDEVKKAKAEDVDGVIGMKRKLLLSNRNGSTIWFTIKVEDICDRGDFDFMSDDMRNLGVSSLLLTVEPFFGETKDTPSRRIEIKRKNIVAGHEVNFTFPFTKEKQHYGLYLCSDKSGTKSCKQKSVADYKRNNVEEADRDSVFFFSYFSTYKGKVEILNNVIGSTAIKQFRDYLHKQSDLSPQQRTAIFLTIFRLNRSTKLRTGSVDLSGERINLLLTRLGQVRNCSNIRRDVITAGRDGKVYVTDKNDNTVVAEPIEEDEN